MTVEYLAPGVYVEEIEGGHREIDGVSTSTAPFVGLYLVERARLPATTPAWTDHNQVDPGITLLQVIAYQAESLLCRAGELPEVARLAAARLAVAALALASGPVTPSVPGAATSVLATTIRRRLDTPELSAGTTNSERAERLRGYWGRNQPLPTRVACCTP